jgi:two-component system OmpR family sensor kinase/two-component system sensor histidine kinase BaeS
MRRNLAADVAHELNTPIHIIQGYLEGIQDEVYSPDPETVTVMLEETRLLSRLVEDLRTLSLAEAGQLPLKMSRVDLTELIEDVRISFSGQAEAAQVTIHTEVADDLFIQADPDRLDQILTNLLANALRYSPAKGRIDITATQDADALTITVADTGDGIEPADLPFIFDRFWRADKSRSHADGSGHGLGLAITRQLVQAHGGAISVESQLAQGTKFIIWLPVNPY